ncbi:MAG: hypothetical protein V7K25_24615 [Nostoc sp.]|uniref:hypothetical protein n=1 Tax=Nostoc sp. TaxID=1180 RepID=UPI002FFB7D60
MKFELGDRFVEGIAFLLGTANPATLRLTGECSCQLSVSPSRSLVFAQCWQAAISAWFGVVYLSFVQT